MPHATLTWSSPYQSNRSSSRVPWRVFVAAVVLAPAVVACGHGHGQGASAEGWTVQSSPNVRLFRPAGVDVRTIQAGAEQTASIYRATFFPNLPNKPVDVLVLESIPGYLTRLRHPSDNPPSSWSLESLPGGGDIGRRGLVVVGQSLALGSVPLQVAYQMIHQAMPNAPLWLRLGFGEYLASFDFFTARRFADNHARVCYGAAEGFPSTEVRLEKDDQVAPLPQNHLVLGGPYRGRAVGLLLPITSVLNANWYDYAQESPRWYEQTAYAFVHFLIHGLGAKPAQFDQLMAALGAGQSTESALAAAYPELRLDAIDSVLATYTHAPVDTAYKTGTSQGLCSTLPAAFTTVAPPPAAAPAPVADVQAALDDLARLPLWREPTSWYPTEVLRSRSAPRAGVARR